MPYCFFNGIYTKNNGIVNVVKTLTIPLFNTLDYALSFSNSCIHSTNALTLSTGQAL